MAGVEDEDEYKDALGAADPPPPSPSPTWLKSAAAAGGGGFGRRLFASIPLPASLSAAIGRFSSPKPPAPNVDLGLLLHADPATPADGNGTPASDAASTISSPHLLPLASLQPQHGEDRVAGLGAGMEEEGLELVPAEEQVWPTAEDWEKECLAVDECSANRNGFSLRGQEEEGEQCQGDELGAAVDGCMVQDQEEVVEQEGATEDCAAVVEDQSNNAAVEQCAVDETRAVKDDNAWEVNEKVTEQEGAVSILDAAEDGVAVGSQEEEEDVVVAEQGEDVISVQDQLEVVELCTGDQLRTTTEDNSGQDKDLVEQEEATKYYTALEAVEQCTNDGSKAVKDGNIVEEEERAVALEGALGILDAAKDGAPVESQEEDEDVISVQDQHKVVDQCSGDQLITAADDNAAQGQDVVKHEGATEYYIAVEDVEQCTNDGSRAVKDGNVVEEKDKVAEQVVSVGVLYAAKDCATGESQDEGDVVLAEQIEDSISMQDHHKVVELFTGDQLKATADDNAAQDQEVLEQEGATECYTTLGAVEECTDDESRVAKDGRVVEEKEKPVKHEGAVGVLNAARDNIIVESQEEYVVVAEQCEGDISVHNQDKEVEQCTSGQLKTTMDDNAAEGQEVVDQESAIVDRHASIDDSTVEDQEKEVKQSAGDESRAAKDGNSVEVIEKMVDQDDVIDKRGVIKDGNGVVLLEENSVVVVEQGGDATSLPDVGNVVEQHTSDQLRVTTDDNAAENQEIEEQGAIVERVVNTTDGIGNEDQEKEVEQFSGDELTLTKDENGVEDNEKGDQEDIIDKQGVIKDGSGVDSQEEDVVVTEQGGDGISERDVGNVVKPCTSDQRTTMGGNAVECQEVVEKEGAIFERGATAGDTAVEDQDKEVEQSEGDGSRATKDENVVENATDKQGAPKDGSGVESQEDGDVVAAEQGGDDISVRDEGNVMEQCTCDQQRTTTDDNAAEDQEVVEQEGVVSILGAAKVDIAMESLQEEDIMVAEQVEDGVYVQDPDKVVEQCTSDQLRTSTDGCAEEDQEASRENIGFAAGCSQRPGKLNCRFYMLNGSCSYGSSCHFNHPQLKAKLEVSSSEHRNREVEFLELNRVGLPIREGARKCAYYMRNGTCRYGEKCCFNHPEQVVDAQLHMPTGWDDTNLQSSPHSKKSAEHATINDISSGSEILPPNGSEILPPNILRMLLPPQNVTPCTEEKEMKVKKDADWSSASDDSDGCCSADSSGGPLCKQEHVDYPERPECLFLQRFGNCKFASACQYYHPKDKFPSRYHPKEKFPSRYDSKDNFQSRYLPKRDPPLAELKVYPDRPGQPECPFYMKTGSCKFKEDCKFHHPKDLTPSMQGPASPKRSVVANEHHPVARIPSMQGPASPKRSVAANEHHPAARIPSMQGPASPKGSVTNEHHPAARVTLQDHMYQQHKCPERPSEPDCRYYMQFGKCKFQSACIFNHPKDILSSGWCPAACPFYMKTGTCQFGSACEFSHPKDRCATTGEAIDDGTHNEHGFDPKSENVLQQQEKKIYPQRPGEPECSHYMKHGYCKFQKSCIFHHPTDRLSNK